MPGFLMLEVMCALFILLCISASVAYCQWKISCMAQESALHNSAIDMAYMSAHLDNTGVHGDKTPFTIKQIQEQIVIQDMPLKALFYITTISISWRSLEGKEKSYEIIYGSTNTV